MKILVSVLLLGGLAVLLVISERDFYSQPCKGMKIDIRISGRDTLVTAGEISEMITGKFGVVAGKQLREINLEQIEDLLRQDYYLSQSDASVTVNGILKISCIQRKPLLRLVSGDQSSWILDQEGILIPVKPGFPTYVPVLVSEEGIPGKNQIVPGKDLKSSGMEQLEGARELGLYIESNEFPRALIDQVVIKKSGDFELIPKIPGSTILFGSTERMERKFEDLFWIYKKVLPEKGWEYYKEINLKYENQVVCSK